MPLPPPASAESGQATVELVAAIPFVILAGMVAWQLALAGNTTWVAAQAARAAARAEAVGQSPRAAARSAIPRSMEAGLAVERLTAGGVRVSLQVPLLLQAWRGPLSVSAQSSLGSSRDG